MPPLNHKQIFLDALRLYFAPLTGAVRGCIREVDVVSRQIAQRRQAERDLYAMSGQADRSKH